MRDDERDREARREFLRKLGGPQIIADRYGIENRQLVDNWVRCGYSHKWKPRLIEDAEKLNVKIPPELLTGRREKNIVRFTTKLGFFLHNLASVYGGFNYMALDIGVPLKSLRNMCDRNGRLVLRYASALEAAATAKGIPLPNEWDTWNQRKKTQGYGKRKKVVLTNGTSV